MDRQTEQQLHIENPRNHADGAVSRLKHLLGSGAAMREDSRRPNFFEIDDADRVFYVYLSPITGTIIFLATWAGDRQPEPAAR